MSGQSSGEKTEQPTPKKIRDARKKGQVARSQEVVTSATLLAVILYIWLSWDNTFEILVGLLDRAGATHGREFTSTAYVEISHAFTQSGVILLPLLGIVIAFAIASNYLQFGNIFSFDSITPKTEKISVVAGFKRIFSIKQLVETLKSIFKILFLSILLFYVMRAAISPYLNALPCGLPCLTDVTSIMLRTMLLLTALAFVIVAVFDFIFQRRQHTKSLMMTKVEVKREFKEREGDPQIKGQRKQLREELLMSDDVERTKSSTALLVNPTHFAVAIDYRQGVTPLPIVVAKGMNLHAQDLRIQAELSGVPIFRNVPMARALYADVKIDEFIPDEWFGAVAEILAWVNRNRDQLYSKPLGHGVIDMESRDHLQGGSGLSPERNRHEFL